MRASQPRGRTAWTAYAAWGVLLVDIVLALVFARQRFTPRTVIWLFALAGWLLCSLLVVAILLPILHRDYLRFRATWIALLGLWGASLLISQGLILQQFERLQLVSLLLAVCGGLALVVSLGLLLWQRDIGLALLGWLTLAWIWTLAIFASRQPSLIEAFFRYLQAGRPSPLQWIGLFSLMLCCLVPLALLSAAVHTWRLVRREDTEASPRTPPPDARAQAQRLLDVLTTPSSLACADAQPQIARLVYAETAGHDVDADAGFAPLLAHLDRCATCLALYTAVVEGVE